MTPEISNSKSDVLIVVPCLNEEAHLPAILMLLVAQAGEALVVVVDGGSWDSSPAIVTEVALVHANVRLLNNVKCLQSVAVNLAAKMFGDGRCWLIRIDAHCTYPPGYIDGLIAAAQRRNAQSVVVPMTTHGDACFQKAVACAQNSKLGAGGSAHRTVGKGAYVDHGHHALFDMATFLSVGGYDEAFSHNEDAELDLRIGASGGRIWLEPSLAIVYYPRRAIWPLFRQYLAYGGGRARTVHKHRTRLKFRQILPLMTLPAVALAFAAPIEPVLAVPMLVWVLVCLGYGCVLSLRARDLCVVLSGIAALTMHLGWSAGFWREVLFARRLGFAAPNRRRPPSEA
jgi:succinoglycan biosynthesis protein ExoA